MKRALVATAVATLTLGIGSVVLARTLQYRADPAGEFEVPAVQTSASAEFKLKVETRGQSARFDLKIDEPIDNVTMAHLHLAEEGVNGPVVLWLYPVGGPPAAPPNGEDFEGRLSRGTVDVGDLVGPLAGNWNGFIDALEDDLIYVNVHTSLNPGGEVRDQVDSHGHRGHD